MFVAILALVTLLYMTVPLKSFQAIKQQQELMKELEAKKNGKVYMVPTESLGNTENTVERYKNVPVIPFPAYEFLISTLLILATIGGFINWIL